MRYIHKSEDKLTAAEKLQNAVMLFEERRREQRVMEGKIDKLEYTGIENPAVRGHVQLAVAAAQPVLERRQACVEEAWAKVLELANGYVSLDSAPPSSE